MFVLTVVLSVLIGFTGFTVGIVASADNYQEKCVAKYAEMPHNKVGDYCKTLLKFEKDAK